MKMVKVATLRNFALLSIIVISGLCYLFYEFKSPQKQKVPSQQGISEGKSAIQDTKVIDAIVGNKSFLLSEQVKIVRPQDKEPALASEYNELGQWVSSTSKPEKSLLEQYAKKIEAEPNNCDLHFMYAKACLHYSDKYDLAAQHFKRVLEIASEHESSNTIELWLQKYREQKEQQVIWKAIQAQYQVVASKCSAGEYTKLAELFVNAKMIMPAIDWYKKALTLSLDSLEKVKIQARINYLITK